MVFPVQPSDQEAKRQMVVNGYSTVKESEGQPLTAKMMIMVFFDAWGIVHHEFVPQGQTVNQEVYISVFRRMREALQCRHDLWASGQWTLLHDTSQDFSLNTTLLCFHIPRTALISLHAIFFCSHD